VTTVCSGFGRPGLARRADTRGGVWRELHDGHVGEHRHGLEIAAGTQTSAPSCTRLKAPRATFALDISDEEREIMGRHAACWQPLIEAGQMVVVGPVLDSAGSWGRCDRGRGRAAAFAAGDPVITTGTGSIELGRMLTGYVRFKVTAANPSRRTRTEVG
jgi:hypothetical protein